MSQVSALKVHHEFILQVKTVTNPAKIGRVGLYHLQDLRVDYFFGTSCSSSPKTLIGKSNIGLVRESSGKHRHVRVSLENLIYVLS